MNTSADSIRNAFQKNYGEVEVMVSSPGRINLIGEHTDYNDGFVLPAAINRSIYFVLAKNGTDKVNLIADDLEARHSFSVAERQYPQKSWTDYPVGVVEELRSRGHSFSGFNCVFGGNMPTGAGLSSSAALTCGLAYGLNKLLDLQLKSWDIAEIGKAAENDFAGMPCGIMDQFACVFGKKDSCLKLDCRTLEYREIPLHLKEHALLLCDSKVKHELVSSEYGKRRQECEAGVKALKVHFPEIKNLRDVKIEMMAEIEGKVDNIILQRCIYVLRENLRVQHAVNALKQGNLIDFGRFMYLSHQGLSGEYEVSCEELDFLVDFTADKEYVLGARMMGGGFGGCTINLLEKNQLEQFKSAVSQAYRKQFSIEPGLYEVEVVDGVSSI